MGDPTSLPPPSLLNSTEGGGAPEATVNPVFKAHAFQSRPPPVQQQGERSFANHDAAYTRALPHAISHYLPTQATNPTVGDAEDLLRSQLSRAYRALATMGLGEDLEDLISVRFRSHGRDAFLLKPFTMRFAEVTPDALIVVDASGALVLGEGERISGWKTARAD